MNFTLFNQQVEAQLKLMESSGQLFYVDVERDELFSLYISSFPEGTNPLVKTRTEHDCNCCKSFIRNSGNVVALIDNKMVTIWDNVSALHYDVVAKALAEHVKSKPIAGVYRSDVSKIGNKKSASYDSEGKVVSWDHFGYVLNKKFVCTNESVAQFKGNALTNKEMLEKGLTEISKQACEDVLDLIKQNELYRGAEHVDTIKRVLTLKKEYEKVAADKRQQYLWLKSSELQGACRFKNSSIGKLLTDITSGIEFDDAVRMYEVIVAPHNYRRPTSAITSSMIKKAQKTVNDLGIEPALHRRFAVMEDLTINNVLFADRSAKQTMGALDQLLVTNAKNTPVKEGETQAISINDFIEKVLPKTNSIELMLDNKHMSNMVSLIAPIDSESAKILKWDNNFSWSYTGEVTDSIKERVKQAGGNIDALLRTSLSWTNYDDLDIHVYEPSGERIYFGNRRSKNGGVLDVDMNAGRGTSRTPVENITWKNESNLKKGKYKVIVHNFCKRESSNVGFVVQLEYNGTVWEFNYEKAVGDKKEIAVVEFNYDPKNGVTIDESIDSTQTQKQFWNVTTNKWIKVDLIMNSPNFWDDNSCGNKHWFFVLEDCKNPDSARGFYNEFLRDDLHAHRKVFEVLSSQMKAEPSDNQLSGVGFSSTIPNSVLCKVTGEINRIYEINI